MSARRIFAVVPDCHVIGWRYGAVWRTHFYDGLASAGAEVATPVGLQWDWARPIQTTGSDGESCARTSEQLLQQIQEQRRRGLDAVVSYCFSADLDLDIVGEVRGWGVPWINFFCDSLYAFHTVEALARRTSLNWFVEGAAAERYAALGVPSLCAPYALNPRALPDASCQTAQRALAFVGTAQRERILAAIELRLMGVDIHVRGWGWPERLDRSGHARGMRRVLSTAEGWALGTLLRNRVGGHLDFDAFVEFLRTSRTVLGLNEGYLRGDRPVSYLKLRDVEFPGMGCAYVTQHNADVTNVFEADEVRTFESLWHLREIVTELSRDPAECRRIGERARRRVLAEHTWTARLPQLLAALA